MQLYVDSDPFLYLRPFPQNSDNLFFSHWHEILFFVFFFHGLFLLGSKVNSFIFGSWYDNLEQTNAKLKKDFDVRFVGICQAILSVWFCIPMFFHPKFKNDPVLGEYPFASFVASFTIGYFIWDLIYCCIFHFELYGIEFLFHAGGALFVFGSTLVPFFQPYLCSFLIYELSTPFVQYHFMLSNSPDNCPAFLGKHKKTAVIANGACLILTFFSSRIIWGVFATLYSMYIVWPVKDQYNYLFLIIVYVLNCGFQFLNFTWFSKMIRLGSKLLAGNTTKRSKKNE